MTEVLFYHLQNMTLESVLPPLLGQLHSAMLKLVQFASIAAT